jgi:esterase/lipase
LTYAQITRDWDGLVNLKLDSISIVGWSDGGIIGLEMGVSGKSKKKLLQWVRI